jgi:hypothetical protein
MMSVRIGIEGVAKMCHDTPNDGLAPSKFLRVTA